MTERVGELESMVELEQLIDALQADLSADEFVERGLSVQGTFDEIDDPVLIGPDGTPIMTWKEGYPYDERMSRHDYEEEKRLLQIELLKLQAWLQNTGHKVCLVFEGRDAAGKGGTIKRFMEHLNPRLARVVALGIPTQREQGQWYFQRWIGHLPTAGEIVLFDRSWYTRAVVDRVMGYCTTEQYLEFLRHVPEFERSLQASDMTVIKLWFSVSRRSRSPDSRSGGSTRSASGSSVPATSHLSTAGRTTRSPKRRCSFTPTPERCRGQLFGATTRSAAESKRCDRCSPGSTTPTRITPLSVSPTRSSSAHPDSSPPTRASAADRRPVLRIFRHGTQRERWARYIAASASTRRAAEMSAPDSANADPMLAFWLRVRPAASKGSRKASATRLAITSTSCALVRSSHRKTNSSPEIRARVSLDRSDAERRWAPTGSGTRPRRRRGSGRRSGAHWSSTRAPRRVVRTTIAATGIEGSSRDVELLGKVWPSARLLCGAEVTSTNLLDALASDDLVHVGAHGHLRHDNPMLSMLECADGPVYGYELTRSRRVASTVLLWSCALGGARMPADVGVACWSTLLSQLGCNALIAAPRRSPAAGRSVTDAVGAHRRRHRSRRRRPTPADSFTLVSVPAYEIEMTGVGVPSALSAAQAVADRGAHVAARLVSPGSSPSRATRATSSLQRGHVRLPQPDQRVAAAVRAADRVAERLGQLCRRARATSSSPKTMRTPSLVEAHLHLPGGGELRGDVDGAVDAELVDLRAPARRRRPRAPRARCAARLPSTSAIASSRCWLPTGPAPASCRQRRCTLRHPGCVAARGGAVAAGAGGELDLGDRPGRTRSSAARPGGEDLRGDPLALAHEAEQDVLGADVVVAELEGLAQRRVRAPSWPAA